MIIMRCSQEENLTSMAVSLIYIMSIVEVQKLYFKF